MFLSANLICSNDFDIKEVINDEDLIINISTDDEFEKIVDKDIVIDLYEELTDEDLTGEETSQQKFIVQDTLEGFCYYCAEKKIATKREVRTFFTASLNEDEELETKRNKLNVRLDELP